MGDKLKPCNCGESHSENIIPQVVIRDIEYWAMFCQKCYAKGPHKKTKQEAIDAWNTRPIEDKLRERIEELESIQEQSKKEWVIRSQSLHDKIDRLEAENAELKESYRCASQYAVAVEAESIASITKLEDENKELKRVLGWEGNEFVNLRAVVNDVVTLKVRNRELDGALEAAAKILNFTDGENVVTFGLPGIGYTLFKDFRPMPGHFTERDKEVTKNAYTFYNIYKALSTSADSEGEN